MPDFRKTLDEAKFQPEMTGIATTGPNAEGQDQTWQNPRPQLTQSSAEELAQLLGAKLTPVTYSGGPYSQDKPQWQLDFGTGDLHDAAMVYENYQKRPESFNQQLQDEFKTSQAPSVAAQEAGLDRTGQQVRPSTIPTSPVVPPGTAPPGQPVGPTWPSSPPPNVPGRDVSTTPLPGRPGLDPAIKVGETVPGGYTVPPLPPVVPGTGIPRSLLQPGANEVKGIEPEGTMNLYGGNLGKAPMEALNMPGLLSPGGYKPPQRDFANKGLLGLHHPDGTPMTPEEIMALSNKPPGWVDPNKTYRATPV